MKRRKNINIILYVIIAILFVASITIFMGRNSLLNGLKLFLVEKIEASIQRGMEIEDIGYVPLKGVHLVGVTIYKNRLRQERDFYIRDLYIKVPFLKLLFQKTLSPTVIIDNLAIGKTEVSGAFGFSADLSKKTAKTGSMLESLKKVSFHNFSVRGPFFDIDKISGLVAISPRQIKASGIRFAINKEPFELSLDVKNPAEDLSATCRISSSKLDLMLDVRREDEIYKISKITGKSLNSSFELTGELSDINGADEGLEEGKMPLLSLYGDINIDIEDVGYFLPQESKASFALLSPQGTINNTIYFKGRLGDSEERELGVKTTAQSLKIADFRLNDMRMDTRLKDGVLSVPLLTALPYGGTFNSSMTLDLNYDWMPYRVTCKADRIDISKLLKNTPLGNRNIKGLLFSELSIRGNANDIRSMEGSGVISVQEANLGPMPVLTPLLGNLYGYFQGMLPGLKKIEVTKGSANFYIANRKVMTDNLLLQGDIIGIYARGYIDFDKNLDFDVENKIMDPGEETKEADWRASIQEMIIQFGKMMSKARLTGTLDKPKWKFQYLGGIKNIFGGGLDKVFKGIFE